MKEVGGVQGAYEKYLKVNKARDRKSVPWLEDRMNI